MTVLAIIPARAGSKGLPNKNILDLGGKPLIAWTIEAALKSDVDDVIVSTEDNKIAEIALQYGARVPFIRPVELATDNATRNSVVKHALDNNPADGIVMLLQPTSPFRNSSHINEALDLFISSGAPSCVSVCKMNKAPFWTYKLKDDLSLIPLFGPTTFERRQLMPDCYELNGAIYICRTQFFLSSNDPDPFLVEGAIGYTMLESNSIDIDTWDDMCRAREKVKSGVFLFD